MAGGCIYRVKEDRRPGVAVRDAAQLGACCARCADRRDNLLNCARHNHLSRLRWRDALLHILHSIHSMHFMQDACCTAGSLYNSIYVHGIEAAARMN